MRAIYLPEIFKDKTVELPKEKIHHFTHVLKLKNHSEVLCLNGKGSYVRAQFISSSKKQAQINRLGAIETKERELRLEVFIAQLKKDAMDLAVKNLCELGVGKIFIGQTQYAQTYELNEQRLDKIVLSAMEQSNNLYKPEIILIPLEELPLKNYSEVCVFTTEIENKKFGQKNSNNDHDLLIIGPEGGFGPEDHSYFKKFTHIQFTQLKTPILRAPNAVSCAVGFYLGVRAKS